MEFQKTWEIWFPVQISHGLLRWEFAVVNIDAADVNVNAIERRPVSLRCQFQISFVSINIY